MRPVDYITLRIEEALIRRNAYRQYPFNKSFQLKANIEQTVIDGLQKLRDTELEKIK